MKKLAFAASFVCIVVGLVSPQSAADSLTMVGRALHGPAASLDVSGNTAYIGAGGALVAVEVSDMSAPVFLDDVYFPGTVNDLQVVGQSLYIANMYGGLRVADISDPSDLVEVDSLVGVGIVAGLFVHDTLAYLAAWNDGLRIVHAQTLSEIGHFASDNAHDVFVDDTLAYLCDCQSGLRIVDVTDPSSPWERSSYDTPGCANHVAIDTLSHIAYVADCDSGLCVVNIINPDAPALITQMYTGECVEYVVLRDTLAFLANGYYGLLILNISVPALPETVGVWNSYRAYSLKVVGNRVYVADANDGLVALDVTMPASPALLGRYDAGDQAFGVFARGAYAYVAFYGDGLAMVNAADPGTTDVLVLYGTSGEAWDVHGDESRLLMASGAGGLYTYSFNEVTPIEEGHLDTPGWAHGVCAADTIAYVADHDSGLIVVDISDLASPVALTTLPTPGTAWDVFLGDTILYVTCGDSGLYLVNVSEPSAPVGLYRLATAGHAADCFVVDSLVYIADGDAGLTIANAKDPLNPYVVSVTPMGGYVGGIFVSDDTAYAGAGYAGLCLLDVSDATSPTGLGCYFIGLKSNKVFVAESMIYVTHGWGGMSIWAHPTIVQHEVGGRIRGVRAERLRLISANPSSSLFRLSLNLPETGPVELAVYDMLGRRMRTLIDEVADTGQRSVTWDSKDDSGNEVPNGVYFCRLHTGGSTSTKKLTLLR